MKKSTLSILVLSLCWLALPALADEKAGGEAAPVNAASPEASPSGTSETAEKKTVLQGGVRGSAVRLEEGLALIEQSAKMVQAPALEIAKECTRKETAVARGPNYIGNGIVIPAIGNPNGTFQIGELPARKDRVESFLSAEEDAIKALRSHVDGLIVPEGSSEDLVNLWKGMQSTMQAAENNINSMRELVAQTPVKRGEIKQKDAKPLGRAALKVYDSMTALEKMRSQMDSMVAANLKKE
jgi:hypothetical protein